MARAKWTEGAAQMVEHLLCKLKAESKLQSHKKKRKKKKKE
jgi:hypothetical protein